MSAVTHYVRTAGASCEAWKALNQHVVYCAACQGYRPCAVAERYLAEARDREAALAAGQPGGTRVG